MKGKNGKSSGGNAPTLGIIGRLGGIGARPEMTGFVSDGDGALACLAGAAKAIDMALKGDQLEGDVIFSTHICPTAPTLPHEPVPFMNSPVDISVMNENEVEDTMDAILSIDTTKGNQVCNHKGFAITPTVKEGYILKLVMIYCTYIHNLLAFLQLSCQSRCKTLHPMVMVYSISIVFYNQQLQHLALL